MGFGFYSLGTLVSKNVLRYLRLFRRWIPCEIQYISILTFCFYCRNALVVSQSVIFLFFPFLPHVIYVDSCKVSYLKGSCKNPSGGTKIIRDFHQQLCESSLLATLVIVLVWLYLNIAVVGEFHPHPWKHAWRVFFLFLLQCITSPQGFGARK